MISRIYHRMPGPAAVRVLLIILAVLVILAVLGLFYEWVVSTFLDTGGRIG